MKKRDFFRASLARDHNEPGRGNPLFPVQKLPLWKRLFLVLGPLFVLIVGGTLGLRYAMGEEFYIHAIDLPGLSTLPSQDIESKVNTELDKHKLLFFKKRHKWFVREDEVKDLLESHFPLEVQNVTVDGNILRISIIEDVLMTAFKSNDSWFLVGLDGKVSRQLTAEEIPLLDAAQDDPNTPIPYDRLPKIELLASEGNIGPERALLDPAFVASLLDLDHGVRSIGLEPKRYRLEVLTDSWVRLTSQKPYAVLIDLEKPLDEQLLTLKTVMDSHAADEDSLSYIDVRFGNHVYVK